MTDPHASDPARRRTIVTLILGALAIVLAATGVVLLVTAPSDAAGDQSNLAVVDQRETAQVVGQVDTALQRVLTYQWSNPSATHAAAEQVLVGVAAKQYDTLFTALQQKAAGQKLTLTATVVKAGVTQLSGGHADLLVFLDQSSTRASDGTTSTSAAQLRIAATLQGGVWRISALVPL